eukprot:753319-Hanusia_phi.AAC.4
MQLAWPTTVRGRKTTLVLLSSTYASHLLQFSSSRPPPPSPPPGLAPFNCRRAYYGEVGKSAQSCLLHRQANFVDLTSKHCEYARDNRRCLLQANFGCASERRKRFCSKHKREGDVDLRLRNRASQENETKSSDSV